MDWILILKIIGIGYSFLAVLSALYILFDFSLGEYRGDPSCGWCRFRFFFYCFFLVPIVYGLTAPLLSFLRLVRNVIRKIREQPCN